MSYTLSIMVLFRVYRRSSILAPGGEGGGSLSRAEKRDDVGLGAGEWGNVQMETFSWKVGG